MAPRPKVLVVTPDFPPVRGGIQVLVHRVVSNFDRLTPRVVTEASQGAEAFDRRQPFEVIRTDELSRFRPLSLVRLNVRALEQAVRWRPDVVISAHIVMSPTAAAITRTLGVPFVQYLYAKEVGAKPRLAHFAVTEAAAVIAISRYTAGLGVAVGADPRSVHLITPGVDLPPPADRRPAERPTLLTISRLEDRYKGHDVIMRALPLIAAKIPDVNWVIIGDGPLRDGLEQLASAQMLGDRVQFLGAVDNDTRDAWLRRAQVFVMPSRLPAGGYAGEGFGIVYLEANAFGLPVVAGNVAGALDAVADEETGLLVDPSDPVALAQAVTRLLADPAAAEALGRRGQERAEAFTWPRISERVEDLLLSLAHRAPPPEATRYAHP